MLESNTLDAWAFPYIVFSSKILSNTKEIHFSLVGIQSTSNIDIKSQSLFLFKY